MEGKRCTHPPTDELSLTRMKTSGLGRKKPRIRDNFVYQELDGHVVLLDRNSKRVFKLNPSASLIFYFCDGDHAERSILMEMSRVFKDVERDVLAGDLRRTLATFKREGIID